MDALTLIITALIAAVPPSLLALAAVLEARRGRRQVLVTKKIAKQTHVLVNSQKEAMTAEIVNLKKEIADLKRLLAESVQREHPSQTNP